MIDARVPRCARGNHWCAELCEIEHGKPCVPADGQSWRPFSAHGRTDVGAVANYRLLRAALPDGELSERQQRCMRWIAGWDHDTAEAIASLFRFAAGRSTDEAKR